MQILLVDDDRFTRELLARMLNKLGRHVATAQDGHEALQRIRKGDIQLVITDWEMPGMNGLELCRAIRQEDLPGYVYVIMLTARQGLESRIEGLDAGADDFLCKSPNIDELVVRFKTAERILALETRDVALFALARLAESRDPETGAHLDRVQNYTRLIARQLTQSSNGKYQLNDHYIRILCKTSPLHDIGKVGIPDHILLKPGKLTDAEYAVMKTHTTLGAQTLDAALQRFPQATFLEIARDVAATHHEKFDGTGYPRGLAGEQIPLCGRIVAVADVYDALTSRRVYKDAMPHAKAMSIIHSERGKHFDPDILDAFVYNENAILQIFAQFRDTVQNPIAQLAA